MHPVHPSPALRRPRIVVVGNGMAGLRLVEELVAQAPGSLDVTVLGAEPQPAYNRILLSPVLAGEQGFDDIGLRPASWYAEQGVTLHTGCTVTAIDRLQRQVCAQTRAGAEQRVSYDHLVLATGSRPVLPPWPGHQLRGVFTYRDRADTEALIAAAGAGVQAVVIGGGLLGLEAAHGLAQRGCQVTVVHLGAWLLERQLDATAGALLAQALQERGLHFALSAQTAALRDDGCGQVGAVELADGRALPATLVVVAAGVRPDTALAEAAGLQCARGVVVHDTLQTVTDPRIWAVGECASHRGTAYGLVAPLYEQAQVCASHLAGRGTGRYAGSTVSTQLKVSGIDAFSAGDFTGDEHCEHIRLLEPGQRVYRHLVIRDDQLIGACLFGDTLGASDYARWIRSGQRLGPWREHLLFEPVPPPARAADEPLSLAEAA